LQLVTHLVAFVMDDMSHMIFRVSSRLFDIL
jgi:hypothetical protein